MKPARKYKERVDKGQKRVRYRRIMNPMFYSLIKQASARRKQVHVLEDELPDSCQCAFCGLPAAKYTLDDPQGPYTHENILGACRGCATAKGILTGREFRELCRRVARL